MKRLLLATLAICLLGLSFAPRATLASTASGERTLGQVSIEPAYNDATGTLVYLATPAQLAPLSPTNPINTVNQHAAAPLYIVVYPPGTAGTFNCMGVPGNCPDHDGVIAGVATGVEPTVYGTDAALVPGHDHLVGIAASGGDFNVPWHVYIELFTPGATITHITTLSELQRAWATGAIDASDSGRGIDTGITFVCAVVSQAAYDAGTPVS
jgi:hypothetical protein